MMRFMNDDPRCESTPNSQKAQLTKNRARWKLGVGSWELI
jgi:hypothetical protein